MWITFLEKTMNEKGAGKRWKAVNNVNILIDRLLELDESFDTKQDIRLKVEDFD
jgi:hypothetical protein